MVDVRALAKELRDLLAADVLSPMATDIVWRAAALLDALEQPQITAEEVILPALKAEWGRQMTNDDAWDFPTFARAIAAALNRAKQQEQT